MKIRPARSLVAFLFALPLFGAAMFLTQGCNTTEGAGRDIEAAGDAIEDAADDAND
jgi:predicted small secreted protein